MSEKTALALESNVWPFVEARKIQQRYNKNPPSKGYVLFATGYGPSGLPHIGTFAEVVRTTMVREAFKCLCAVPTRMFCFSDDRDGLRKIPENIPNPEVLRPYLGKPLTDIPDPFGTHSSFGAYNNARLCAFLDKFNFDYEFQSSTEWYRSGWFDRALLRVLERYKEILDILRPTLGPERAQTYSPFLPISPATGRVLQVPILQHNLKTGTIVFQDEDGKTKELPVTSGHCKLQWKPDWAMRWYTLGVDYEMSGKDLSQSYQISAQVCKILGASPPEGFHYELFLDHENRKISKSKGSGFTVEEWLAYAPFESLSLFMYQKPRSAKRLHFDVIPRMVDEYLTKVTQFHSQTLAQRLDNPIWHVHKGEVPRIDCPVSFNLLLNLASVVNAESKDVLWGFVQRYAPATSLAKNPYLDVLITYAIHYYQDHVKPYKTYRKPTPQEYPAFVELLQKLYSIPLDAQEIQSMLYSIGKKYNFPTLQAWFQSLYEVLLGQKTGPRMGTFIVMYGVKETRDLLQNILSRQEIPPLNHTSS